MKVRVWIVNAMNQIREKKLNLKNGTFEFEGNTYVVESPYVLSKGNRKYVIHSKGMVNSAINPMRESAKDLLDKIDKSNTVKFESSPYDTQFQILLHTKGLKDMLGDVKENFMAMLMMLGAGLLLGVIIMAVAGHIRL